MSKFEKLHKVNLLLSEIFQNYYIVLHIETDTRTAPFESYHSFYDILSQKKHRFRFLCSKCNEQGTSTVKISVFLWKNESDNGLRISLFCTVGKILLLTSDKHNKIDFLPLSKRYPY